MSGGHRRQGYTTRNELFLDIGKPPVSVFCAHFSDKPGTLYLFSGVCVLHYLDWIDFTA